MRHQTIFRLHFFRKKCAAVLAGLTVLCVKWRYHVFMWKLTSGTVWILLVFLQCIIEILSMTLDKSNGNLWHIGFVLTVCNKLICKCFINVFIIKKTIRTMHTQTPDSIKTLFFKNLVWPGIELIWQHRRPHFRP